MKKILFSLFLMLFIQISCHADTMKVMSISKISTLTPDARISVLVLEDVKLTEYITISEGCLVNGSMVSITSPKRLKKDATFTFKPYEYITPEHKVVPINEDVVGKYSPKIKIEKGKIAKSTALFVADKIFAPFSYSYYAVEGAVKNKDGHVITSSVKNVYENSPLSYIKKGSSNITIEPETKFSFIFPKVGK